MSEYIVRIGGEESEDDGWTGELPGAGWEFAQAGECPDCGGKWVWFEAGYVPGTRKCLNCGSMFSVQQARQQGGSWTLRRERFY